MTHLLDVCGWTVLCLIIIQIVRFIFADCDLHLQWTEVFGRSPATLKGKVVWVTGASSGIGEALVYKLLSAGCRLVLSSRREEDLDRVKAQCLLSGSIKDEDVLVVPLDMVKQDEHQGAVQTVLDHFKQIDILVNNAGRSQSSEWVRTSLDMDRQVLETNVLGTLSLTKAVLSHMLERNAGHIVVTSSMGGKIGLPYSASYAGSKHALHGWFESLRIDTYEQNIKVTMVCPGPVVSNISSRAFTEDKGNVLTAKVAARQTNILVRIMQTSRCAGLMAVAMANQMEEVWIANQPYLGLMYAAQYCPSLGRRLTNMIVSMLRRRRKAD